MERVPQPPIERGSVFWSKEPLLFLLHVNLVEADYITKKEDGLYRIEITKNPISPFGIKPVRVPAPKKRRLIYTKQSNRWPTEEELKIANEKVYNQLLSLRETFLQRGRNVVTTCKCFGLITIEQCLSHCADDCDGFDPKEVLGERDTMYDLLLDIVKLQRLVNILYNGFDLEKRQQGT